jgi:hypothetical protein
MTRQEILDSFDVDEHGIIQSPGKFEGEMVYAPHYYSLIMDGCADETEYDDDDTPIDYFDVSSEDTKEFPELKGVKRLVCFEDSSGFFYCSIVK